MTHTATDSAVELLRTAMFTREGRRDPYPYLERLHDHGTHVHMPEGYVVVWGYEAAQELMRSPLYGRVPPDPETRAVFHHELTPEQVAQLRRVESTKVGKWFQLVDPPEHTRLRSLVSRAFTPKRVEASRPLVERTIHELLDGIEPGMPFDFVSRLGFPVPTQVVGDMIGLPIDEREWFSDTTQLQAADRDPHAPFEALLAAAKSRDDLARYLLGLIEARKQAPEDDLATALIKVHEAGDTLSEPELVAVILMLYMAGWSTTAHMLANGVHALLRNPDELARLRADRTLVPSAIEEILRYDSMVITVDYNAKEDNELLGDTVVRNTPVHVFLGAANRDPAVFTDPSRFDIGRKEAPTIAFGAGVHFCIGAALARLEGVVVLGALLDRFGSMELADPDPPRRDSFNFREFETLSIVLDRPTRV